MEKDAAMAQSYVSLFHLGIDLGTGSLKLAAYEARNESSAYSAPLFSEHSFSASCAYPIVSPEPGVAETDPEEWVLALRAAWSAVQAQIEAAGLVPKLESIGISGQMHGFVPLGRNGQALHNAITWADLRGAEYADTYSRLLSGAFDRLLNAPAAGLTALILLWMKHHTPELYYDTSVILFPKDYLRYRLTGKIATDAGDASASLLWDFKAHSWSREALDLLGLDGSKLPPVLDSFSVAGFVTADASRETGLPEGVPVAVGSADKACELYGSGFFREYFGSLVEPQTAPDLATAKCSPSGHIATGPFALNPIVSELSEPRGEPTPYPVASDSDWKHPRVAQVSIGTGIQVVVPVRGIPLYSPSLNFFETCAAGLGYRMAAMLNGGLALEWVRATLQRSWDSFYQEMREGKFQLPQDLIFLPYITGERSPYQNPNARGAWIGLGLHHTNTDMLAAALLGVACTIRLGIETLGIAQEATIYCVGGSTRYRPWMDIVSAMTGRRLFISPEPNASVRGAAALGAAAIGAAAATRTRIAASGAAPSRGSLTEGLSTAGSGVFMRKDNQPPVLETSPLEAPQPAWMNEYYDRFLKYYGALFGR